MKKHIRKGRWYGYAWVLENGVGRQIEFTLDAYAQEETKAIINLGRALEIIEGGGLPNTKNLKFKKVAERWKRNPVSLKEQNHGSDYNFRILDETLTPYFGEMKVKEISRDMVRAYLRLMESDKRPLTKNRSGKGFKATGKKKSSLMKELRVLRWVMQSICKTWDFPYWDFKNPEKEKTDSPRFDQIAEMIVQIPEFSKGTRGKSWAKEYQDIAWVMAYTGLDISDVLSLSRSSFQDGYITGKRGKTGKRFTVATGDEVRAIVKRQKTVDLLPTTPIFNAPSSKAVSTVIRRAFHSIGLKFNTKSLRDFQATSLDEGGFSEPFIQKTLGHSPGSKQTRKYIVPSKAKLKEAARYFDSLSVIKKEGNKR